MSEKTIPQSYTEQAEVIFVLKKIHGPRFEEVRTALLHDEVCSLLMENQIQVAASSWRTKSRMSIEKKLTRPTRPILPLGDIYGLKFILAEMDIPIATEKIREHWPTPDQIRGMSTIRTGPNQLGSDRYYSERLNIIFDENKIAEIQLVTPEQEDENQRLRPFYEAKRGY